MAGLYLTIDDSPSGIFPDMCAYLKSKYIPAVFFARGDLMSLYPERIVQAIKDGFVIANHSWSHHRASKLGTDLAVAEILKTQALIDELYARAGVARPGPYLRFPYMDSGLGGWPLPPAAFTGDARLEIETRYVEFYGNDKAPPDETAIERHNLIAAKLRAHGFRQMTFGGVTIPWYSDYTASSAVSTQGTFCHPDWWLYRRYEGKHPQDVSVLNTNLDTQIAAYPNSEQVLVLHDAIELWPHFANLIQHALNQGHRFLPIPA